MKTRLYTAIALSAFLAAGSAHAQSGTAVPNTLHGSGNMMQDGPHAAPNPYASATGVVVPSPRPAPDDETVKQVCERRWREARVNGTAPGVSHGDFISACRSSI
jgi:hypothetical protein